MVYVCTIEEQSPPVKRSWARGELSKKAAALQIVIVTLSEDWFALWSVTVRLNVKDSHVCSTEGAVKVGLMAVASERVTELPDA